MKHGKWITVGAVTLGVATAAWAITGKSGWTVTTVATAAAIRADGTYPSWFAGEHWQDLSRFEMWPPNNTGGQRDGLAVDNAGNVYALVNGSNYDGTTRVPQYSGIVKIAGTTITTILQDCMAPTPPATSAGNLDEIGSRIDGVFVCPTDQGPLTKGHLIVRRWVDETSGVNARFPGNVDLVDLDPATGAETPIYRFANLSHYLSAVAIDGTGTATDGTIYVNMWDGTIDRLRYVSGAWTRDTLPSSVLAESGMRVGPDGSLFTFPVSQSHAMNAAQVIHRVNPATWATSVWGTVDGKVGTWSWTVDASGQPWFGIGASSGSYSMYLAPGTAGGKLSATNRIAESNLPPMCLTKVGDTIYLLEDYMLDRAAIYALRPGSGGKGK